MDAFYRLGFADHQVVVAAFEVVPAKVRCCQFLGLQTGSHGAVKYKHSLLKCVKIGSVGDLTLLQLELSCVCYSRHGEEKPLRGRRGSTWTHVLPLIFQTVMLAV